MATIDEQISANTAKINTLSAQRDALRAAALDWETDANNDDLPGLKGSDRYQSALAEKNRKLGMASNYRLQADELQTQINTLTRDNNVLINNRTIEANANAQTQVVLAQQGQTTASVLAGAEAQARAVERAAEATAEVQKTEANTNAGIKKAIALVVIVAVVVFVVIVIKKMKKAKQ